MADNVSDIARTHAVSVRCHAVVTPDGIHANVILKYVGDAIPAHGGHLTLTAADISVTPFISETHSTIDYNGIAVVGDIDLTGVTLTAETLSSTVKSIFRRLRRHSSSITFMPL